MGPTFDTSENERIFFDYTAFLSKSCLLRLSLLDVLKTLIPSFDIMARSNKKDILSRSADLEKEALKVLSTNVSDTQNLIRLLRLAKNYNITQLIISLPYSLELPQLSIIEKKMKCTITLTDNDGEELLIYLNKDNEN